MGTVIVIHRRLLKPRGRPRRGSVLNDGTTERDSEARKGKSGGLPDSYRRSTVPERKRPGKKGRRRSRTIATKRLSKEELALAEELSLVNIDRPVLRDICATGTRPCPYVSCKHHLYLDVNPETGSIKLNFPDLEVWEMAETCALDVADRGGITLEEVGEILNLTRERIRQVEAKALRKLRHASRAKRLSPFVEN